jgi:hypothetical protein
MRPKTITASFDNPLAVAAEVPAHDMWGSGGDRGFGTSDDFDAGDARVVTATDADDDGGSIHAWRYFWVGDSSLHFLEKCKER